MLFYLVFNIEKNINIYIYVTKYKKIFFFIFVTGTDDPDPDLSLKTWDQVIHETFPSSRSRSGPKTNNSEMIRVRSGTFVHSYIEAVTACTKFAWASQHLKESDSKSWLVLAIFSYCFKIFFFIWFKCPSHQTN